jgi:LAO/AO transport system kinase
MSISSSKNWAVEEYVGRILQGDRVALGKAITLVESTRQEHRQKADAILENCLPYTGNSFRLGITGPPGVGKSSFIEAFGGMLTMEHGRRLAVLAIDPSSQVSHGSILGDKTRMEQLSNDPNAFIRPSPAGKTLGGVTNCTHEAILLCEAAGFDTIFIETVGVGQSETAVADLVDFLLLLLLPGAGDELQGIKRGIVEMADLIAINKADGERLELAKAARKDYAQALHLFPAKESGWQPKAETCSALTRAGLDEVWGAMVDYQGIVRENGWFERNRLGQIRKQFSAQHELQLRQFLFSSNEYVQKYEAFEKAVLAGQISIRNAISQLLENFNTQ